MKKCISQEGLKILACVSMLVDHIGAVFFPRLRLLRIIGRIAMPIFCYLLVQGDRYTRNPGRYALRLLTGAVLSEFSFDYLFWGGITWEHQSVMVTLLIGFGMLQWMKRMNKWGKVLPLALGFVLAELCRTDYGGWGVAMIWIFAVTGEDLPGWLLRVAGLGLVCWFVESAGFRIGSLVIPSQLFALFSLLPIFLYSGKKHTANRWLQRGFYLFYPAHLTLLLAIVVITR